LLKPSTRPVPGEKRSGGTKAAGAVVMKNPAGSVSEKGPRKKKTKEEKPKKSWQRPCRRLRDPGSGAASPPESRRRKFERKRRACKKLVVEPRGNTR